jgi:acrylyl-CoA reductase (NADPH)
VTLSGVNSVQMPTEKREKAWKRLAKDLDFAKLDVMTSHARLDDVPCLATEIVEGKVRGRVVIDL